MRDIIIIIRRGAHALESIAYPSNAPLTARPDWPVEVKDHGSDLESLSQRALNPFRTGTAAVVTRKVWPSRRALRALRRILLSVG